MPSFSLLFSRCKRLLIERIGYKNIKEIKVSKLVNESSERRFFRWDTIIERHEREMFTNNFRKEKTMKKRMLTILFVVLMLMATAVYARGITVTGTTQGKTSSYGRVGFTSTSRSSARADTISVILTVVDYQTGQGLDGSPVSNRARRASSVSTSFDTGRYVKTATAYGEHYVFDAYGNVLDKDSSSAIGYMAIGNDPVEK